MPTKTGRERYAVAGMVFGVAAIPLLYPWPLSVASAIIGLSLSVIGIKSIRRQMAIAGIVCSSICLALIAVATVEEILYRAAQHK